VTFAGRKKKGLASDRRESKSMPGKGGNGNLERRRHKSKGRGVGGEKDLPTLGEEALGGGKLEKG